MLVLYAICITKISFCITGSFVHGKATIHTYHTHTHLQNPNFLLMLIAILYDRNCSVLHFKVWDFYPLVQLLQIDHLEIEKQDESWKAAESGLSSFVWKKFREVKRKYRSVCLETLVLHNH